MKISLGLIIIFMSSFIVSVIYERIMNKKVKNILYSLNVKIIRKNCGDNNISEESEKEKEFFCLVNSGNVLNVKRIEYIRYSGVEDYFMEN